VQAGITLGTLPIQDEAAQCCGWGGQPAVANPEYAQFVTKRRAEESTLPYITYCINCRDSFLESGKEASHILEILFPDLGRDSVPQKKKDSAHSPDRSYRPNRPDHPDLPTATERRQNRTWLKQYLYHKYTEEEMTTEEPTYDFRLVIGEELRQKISAERILEGDLYAVMKDLLRTGRTVRHEATGIRSGYKQIGHMTYWVDFAEGDEPDTYTLTGAYAHRMAIDMEGVWNGIKTETDL
jgi:hypothetical protein